MQNKTESNKTREIRQLCISNVQDDRSFSWDARQNLCSILKSRYLIDDNALASVADCADANIAARLDLHVFRKIEEVDENADGMDVCHACLTTYRLYRGRAIHLGADAVTRYREIVVGCENTLRVGRLLLFPASRRLSVNGKTSNITEQQSKIFCVMMKMLAEGNKQPPTTEVLKRAGIPQRRLNTRVRDLFRSRANLWGSVIKAGPRGTLQLLT